MSLRLDSEYDGSADYRRDFSGDEDKMRHFLAALGAAALLTAQAAAHSPYLLPNVFSAEGRDHVTVQASFTESFFAPDVAMKSEDWNVVGPDGVRTGLTPVMLADLALLEVAMTAEGTYRISSGARVGRTAKAYRKDGVWEFLEPGATPPDGTEAVDMQSLTLADTYVTRGKPSPAALEPRGAGLELVPLTHPNEAVAGETLALRVLFDGKPVAEEAVMLHRADEAYAGTAPVQATSTAEGKVEFAPAEPGVYLAMIRYRVAPAAAGEPWRSFTASVTFDVQP